MHVHIGLVRLSFLCVRAQGSEGRALPLVPSYAYKKRITRAVNILLNCIGDGLIGLVLFVFSFEKGQRVTELLEHVLFVIGVRAGEYGITVCSIIGEIFRTWGSWIPNFLANGREQKNTSSKFKRIPKRFRQYREWMQVCACKF